MDTWEITRGGKHSGKRIQTTLDIEGNATWEEGREVCARSQVRSDSSCSA